MSKRKAPMERDMRRALSTLRNLSALAENPLAEQLDGAREMTPELRARRLQAWMSEAIDSVRPGAPGLPPELQDQHFHQLLELRYVRGLSPTAAQSQLGLPRATFFNHARDAIALVARKFADDHGGTEVSGPARWPIFSETDFVGRSEELEILRTLYHQVGSGSGGRIVMITGEEGIGKTRLAREIGNYARQQGGLFIEGRWAPWEGAAPFGAIGECIRQAIQLIDPAELDEVAGTYRNDIAKIDPRLDSDPTGDGDPSMGTEGQQLRVFDGALRVIQHHCNQQPLVLLLDDLHFSPQMNLQLHLSRRLPELKLLMVYTFRENELAARPALFSGRNEMVRSRLVTDIHLNPLTESQVAEVVNNAFGPEVAERLSGPVFERNQGNPFILEEELRFLVQNSVIHRTEDGWDVEDISSLPIPQAVKRLVQARIDGLGQAAADVLRRAAVLGRDFRLDVLATMTGLDDSELSELIEESVLAGVLTDITGDSLVERFRFRAEHVREALYSEITDIRKRRYHREAARALEQITPEILHELAFHYITGTDAENGALYSFRAAEQSSAAFNWNRAIPHYRNAIEIWEQSDGQQLELAAAAESMGNACYKSGQQAQRAAEYFRQSLDLYRELGNQSKVATLLSELGRDYMHGGNLAEQDLNLAAEYFNEAISLMEGEPESVRHGMIYCGLAMAYLDMMEFDEAHSWASRAFELGERIDAPAVIANASVPLGASTAMESLTDAADILERGWQMSVDANLGFQADLSRAYAARVFGAMPKDPRTGIEWVNRGPRYETTYSLFDIPAHLVAFHAMTGEFETAEGHLQELRTRLSTLGQPTYGPWPDELGLLWIRTGALRHAESQLRQALAWSSGSGNRLVEAGTARRLAEVLRYLDRYEESEKNFLRSLDLNRSGRNRMGELALLPHLAMLYCQMDRGTDAAKALVRANEINDRLHQPGALSGDLLQAEAVTLANEGRVSEAENALAAAIKVYERFDRPWDRSRGLYLLAETLSRSNDKAAQSRARDLLSQAASGFNSIGATWWAKRSQPI